MSSLWTENIEMPEFPTLEKDIRTQVLIIGGGMAGVLCAYFLQQAGVDYCLLEKDRICQGVTGHTTAKITAQHGMFTKNITVHGTGACRTVSESKFKSGGKL